MRVREIAFLCAVAFALPAHAQQDDDVLARSTEICLSQMADEDDPLYEGPTPATEVNVYWNDILRACKYAFENSTEPSLTLRYSYARALFSLESYAEAYAIANQLKSDYPAAISIYLLSSFLNPSYVQYRGREIKELAAEAYEKGYKRIDFDVGTAYERAAINTYSAKASVTYYKAAQSYYKAAAEAGDKDAQFKEALLDLVILDQGMRSAVMGSYELNSSPMTTAGAKQAFKPLADDGHETAALYLALLKAIEAGPDKPIITLRAIEKLKKAVDNGIYEASVIALNKLPEFTTERNSFSKRMARDSFETDALTIYFTEHVGISGYRESYGRYQEDPVLRQFGELIKGYTLDDMEIDEKKVLELAAQRGFIPALYLLFEKHVPADDVNTRLHYLLLASLKGRTQPSFDWIYSQLAQLYKQLGDNRQSYLRLFIEAISRGVSRGNPRSALFAASLLHMENIEADSWDWTNYYLQTANKRKGSRGQDASDSEYRFALQELLKTQREIGDGVSEKLYKTALEMHGDIFLEAVLEDFKERTKEEKDPDTLRATQLEAFKLASLDNRFQTALADGVITEIQQAIDTAVTAALPLCAGSADVDNFMQAVWDHTKKVVRRKEFAGKEEYFDYAWVEIWADGQVGSFLLVYSDEFGTSDALTPGVEAKSNRPIFRDNSGHSSSRWWRSVLDKTGLTPEIYSLSQYRWIFAIPGKEGAIQAQKNGQETIRYLRGEDKSAQQITLDFSNFKRAYDLSVAGYNEAKRKFDAKECRPS